MGMVSCFLVIIELIVKVRWFRIFSGRLFKGVFVFLMVFFGLFLVKEMLRYRLIFLKKFFLVGVCGERFVVFLVNVFR